MTKTCEWIPTCEQPAVGIGGPHPHHGTANVCASCQAAFDVPLIKTFTTQEN